MQLFEFFSSVAAVYQSHNRACYNQSAYVHSKFETEATKAITQTPPNSHRVPSQSWTTRSFQLSHSCNSNICNMSPIKLFCFFPKQRIPILNFKFRKTRSRPVSFRLDRSFTKWTAWSAAVDRQHSEPWHSWVITINFTVDQTLGGKVTVVISNNVGCYLSASKNSHSCRPRSKGHTLSLSCREEVNT